MTPSPTFAQRLEARLTPYGDRLDIADRDLAPLLGLSLPGLRGTITRNLASLPPGEVFHPGGGPVWALTELGALLVTSRVRTPQAAAASVIIIRELAGAP